MNALITIEHICVDCILCVFYCLLSLCVTNNLTGVDPVINRLYRHRDHFLFLQANLSPLACNEFCELPQ